MSFLNDGGFAFHGSRPPAVAEIEDPSRFAIADSIAMAGSISSFRRGSSGHLAILRGHGDGRFTASPARAPRGGIARARGGRRSRSRWTDEIVIAPPPEHRSHCRPRRRRGRQPGAGAARATRARGSDRLHLPISMATWIWTRRRQRGLGSALVAPQSGRRALRAGRVAQDWDRPEAVLAGDLNGDRIPDS